MLKVEKIELIKNGNEKIKSANVYASDLNETAYWPLPEGFVTEETERYNISYPICIADFDLACIKDYDKYVLEIWFYDIEMSTNSNECCWHTALDDDLCHLKHLSVNLILTGGKKDVPAKDNTKGS